MSGEYATLQILHQTFKNSLKDDPTKQYIQNDSLKVSLRRHQSAVIERMCEHEKEFLGGKNIKTSKLYSKYGILGDSVGVGKTFMVLGHIGMIKSERNVINFPNFNMNSNKHMYSLEHNSITDISNVGCLVVVPHTLFRQWSDEITNKTNLKVALMKTKKNVWSDKFMATIKKADIVLVSNTLFKELYTRSFELNLFWNRIYIDEADTIELTSTLLKTALPTNFVWLITASFSHLLFPTSYNIYISNNSYTSFKEKYGTHSEMDSFLQSTKRNTGHSNMFILSLYTRSARYLNDLLNGTHPLRGHAVIRCSRTFINQSISLPTLHSHVIMCKPSISHTIVYDIISSSVKQLLNAGDIKSALEELGVKTENNQSLIEAVNENKMKELERLEKTFEFKQSLEYSSPQIKEQSLNHLQEKINHIKEQMKSMKERIENYKNDVCPICYDEANDALLTPCCTQIFCAMCVLQSISRNPTCPMCRANVNPSSLKKLSTENVVVSNSMEIEDSNQPKKKIDTFFDIIEKNPKGKFLVFSRFDNSFVEVLDGCKTRHLIAKELKGSKDMIASMLNNFKEGNINILLMNTIQMGAGLNITEASHVILLHSMTHEEEKQILGRAYRVGRTEELQFIKLLYPGEVS
jgi:hypothetical protein